MDVRENSLNYVQGILSGGVRRIGCERYVAMLIGVAAQATTIAMTWPVWQIRESPPHLPMVELPQAPFGWLLLISLAAMLVRPRIGLAAHVALLLISFVFDQFRTQPQFIAIAVLMAAAVEPKITPLGRWFLAALWLWAGLHKFLSPDWFSFRSFEFTAALGIDPQQYSGAFAVAVALAETSLGVLALIRPRWAAWPCVAMHLGIVVFLSPWFYNWNVSVMPWNLCSAAVGWWLLRNTTTARPQSVWEAVVAAALLIAPAGFYIGWVDHGIASVLYSSHLPRGQITDAEGPAMIVGWGDLRVPFPNERRLFRLYFEQVARPGDKIHIADPRPRLPDQYFLMQPDGSALEIPRDRFFTSRPGEVAGAGIDSRRSVFLLTQAGATLLKRKANSNIYAMQIPPSAYDAQLLALLSGLPNLEQLQLSGCPVTDDDLVHLHHLPKLTDIGLDHTRITNLALEHLSKIPNLEYIEHAGTEITPAEVKHWGFIGSDAHECDD